MYCGDRGDASAAANWRLALLRDHVQLEYKVHFTVREDLVEHLQFSRANNIQIVCKVLMLIIRRFDHGHTESEY